jgi:hypothetical protein
MEAEARERRTHRYAYHTDPHFDICGVSLFPGAWPYRPFGPRTLYERLMRVKSRYKMVIGEWARDIE